MVAYGDEERREAEKAVIGRRVVSAVREQEKDDD